MTEKETSNDMNNALFVNLVMMLASSAMQQLGKIVNPMTNQTEVNLEGARISIDMLGMVREKTKGNLDGDEIKMCNDLLSSLQVNYVETAKEQEAKEARTGKATKEDGGNAQQAGAEKKADTTQASGTTEEKSEESSSSKYHRSYGS